MRQYRTDANGSVIVEACIGPVEVFCQHPNYSESLSYERLPERIALKAKLREIQGASVVASSVQVIEMIYPSYGIATEALSPQQLESNDASSLAPALNSIAGVKMDERGNGGSRRISIRGSFVRSPFAVRNIGMYLDWIPLSSPDGSSPLEIIDPSELAGAEVIKGPAGSIYGSGNGGVLFFRSNRPREKGLGFGSETTVGSFNYIRNRSTVSYRNNKGWIQASYIHQSTDGYREQEYNRKNQFIIKGEYRPNNKLNYFLYYNHYNGEWGLPGSINREQAEEDPTMALEYSKNIGASVDRKRDFYAVRQDWFIRSNLISRTSVYFNDYDKVNPYGTNEFFNGKKFESGSGFGGRSSLSWFRDGRFNINVNSGVELQTETGQFEEHPLSLANPSEDLIYSNETDFNRAMFFLKSKLAYKDFSIEPSLSYNSYEVVNKGYSFALDTTLDENFSLDPSFLGGLSIAYRKDRYELLAAYHEGISEPGLFELVDVETGILNASLQPESGSNTEVTFRYFSKDRFFNFEVTAYNFRLNESIAPLIDEVDRISYINQGEAVHNGLEARLSYRIDFTEDSFLERILLRSSFAAQEYKLDEERNRSRVPGVPLATASNMIRFQFARTFSLDLNHYWSDKTPLNTENAAYLNAYNVINTRLMWEKEYLRWNFRAFAGINNLSDSFYTSFPQINAFGGRFFNPSPERNWYTGFAINLALY